MFCGMSLNTAEMSWNAEHRVPGWREPVPETVAVVSARTGSVVSFVLDAETVASAGGRVLGWTYVSVDGLRIMVDNDLC